VEKFGVDRMVDEYVDVYQRIVRVSHAAAARS
jgi:hypothetical protein